MLGGASAAYGGAYNAPAGSGELSLKQIARYNSAKEAIGKNGVEIVSYDAVSQKAFTVNGDKRSMDIIDFSQLQAGSTSITNIVYGADNNNLIKRILIQSLGEPAFDDVTSIAVHPDLDLVAVAVLAVKPNVGHIAFFNKNGDYLKKVTAGFHPDMLTFTPDGTKLLVANEGEPTDGTYADDPKGSVSIISLAGGIDNLTDANVSDVTFDNLTLADIDANVRIFPSQGGVYHKRSEFPNGNNWSVDFEPEYITVDPSGTYAYVGLQENNAIAKLDIVNQKFLHVYGLGYKDHSLPGNEIDISDKDGIAIKNYPLLGAYMPDGITMYQAGGKTYLVTANEGDSREYTDNAAEYTEETKLGKLKPKLQLNPSKYGNANQSTLDHFLSQFTDDKGIGALKLSTSVYDAVYGETGSAVHDALYTFGARSFSIWDADNIQAGPVFDSGSDFERITAEQIPDFFNLDNEGNAKDKRSTSKGPEPEDVKLGDINGKKYAFVGLERVGGIMVYEVTNPQAPHFVTYVNDRSFAQLDTSTDIGPEGMNFIPAANSPTGKPLLMVAHETSGTLLVYEITTALGQYQVNAKMDSVYTINTKPNGIQTMTVNANVTGWTNFSATVAAVKVHAGEETVVFKQLRSGAQVGLAAVRKDWDSGDNAAAASFNVQAGDVVEVYIVDNLTNDPTVQPIVLQ
ncbi:MAG: hypothetical protein K0R67_2382 [Paenibacillus sp.]|nr:hypothetical protein [Paenibacillus sp.]